ncbi:MAG TPA: hypothetical protein DCS24_08760 [Erythrobacter sp.]|nr:hypothetical protein [Erythrobacter sp.]
MVDFTTGEWAANNRAQIAVADWNASEYIQSPHIVGTGSNTNCPIVSGEIHVCNDDYGGTGWLGIASISVSRGKDKHIVGGVTKVNDFYFDRDQPGSGYNTDVWRQLVMCQEIGHDYGLGHQNEDFNTNTTDSCMEYTSTPTAIDKTPDDHDYEQLRTIYAHSHGSTDDGGGGGGGGGKGGGRGRPAELPSVGNTPDSWGRPVQFLPNGMPHIYSRDIGSYRVITHVTWTIEAARDLMPHGHGGGGDHDH